MPSSVARLVVQDHDRLMRLLRRMCAPGPNQERWRGEFLRLLRAHRSAERDELFPSVVEQLPERSDTVRRQAEHDVVLDELAAEVEAADVWGDDFAGLCDRAEATIRTHADALWSTVLATLEQAVGRKEVRRLGGSYERRREDELRARGGHEPPPRRLDLSRAELYELARRAGVEGRSSMSREQLIDELQRRLPH